MAAATIEGKSQNAKGKGDDSAGPAVAGHFALYVLTFAFCLAALAATCYWSPFAPVTDILWGVSFGSLLISAGRPGSLAGRCLAWRPLVQMGTISYSVYLVQSPVVRQLAVLLRDRHLAPTATLLLFEGVIAPLMLGVGWLFFRLVEGRCLRRGG
jgi:peptidoglycan/LPS O-acetylase OafA/YrhL